MKRLLDLLASTVMLIVLAPLMLVVAMLVRVAMGRPIIFAQERPGLQGGSFHIYKFRTMSMKLDAAGDPLPDSYRLTALGALLRRLSLDELPQLFNVLRGDMSLVGPRPLLMEYLPLYTAEQMRRHDVRPGITGWTQVNGRNALSWEDKFALDVWYVDNHSFWLDLKILAMTAGRVFSGSGVSKEGFVTTEKFRGTAGK